MASVGKYDKSSPFWYAAFTDPLGRRLKKSTGQTSKSRALEVARTWEKASEETRQLRLTEARAREVISELMRRFGGESLTVFTVEQWFGHFVKQKKKSRAAATARRHEQTMREFMEFLGPRAKLNIAAITSRDIAEFRDKRHSLGLAPGTVNLDVVILSSAFNSAWKQGHISVNPCLAIEPLKNKPQRKGVFSPERTFAGAMSILSPTSRPFAFRCARPERKSSRSFIRRWKIISCRCRHRRATTNISFRRWQSAARASSPINSAS
jgi:hypothetical protein